MSAFLNAGLLLYGLLKIGVFKWQPGWALVMFRLLAGCLMLMLCVYWLNVQMSQWFAWGVWQRVGHMALLVSVGVAVYVATLIVLGLRKRHITAI